jgi:tRNA pseudouridine13 synthase
MYVTADLPGIGGELRREIDDFEVTEIPAYTPVGTGDHVFAWIEKRDVSTFDAVARIAKALGVRADDIGTAGLKDRRAVARQMLSLPPPVAPEAALALALDGVRVLEVGRHPHKLRTGHARGNQFRLIVRGVGRAELAAERAREILGRLAEPPGAPNWFGEQRFGRDGDNAAVGRALIIGAPLPGRGQPRRGKKRRLFVSAYQSALFNRYLRARIDDDLYARVIRGDILQKVDSGGIFGSEECEVDQARLDAGELVPTGPMFGHKLRSPAPGTDAALREQAVLTAEGVGLADFARVGKLAEGTRRALAVPLREIGVEAVGDDAVAVVFALPSGAYATSIMREVMKPADDEPATEITATTESAP